MNELTQRRKIILGVAVSLDGFIEGPNGEYDWCFTDQDSGLTEFFNRIDTIFMGRKSFEVASQHNHENPWKGMTTYVFSRSNQTILQPETFLITGDIKAEVSKIKESLGKDIWLFGGAELTTFFINEGLLDELWLSVHPILLGKGKSLFQSIAGRKNLQLISEKKYETGLVSLCYQLNSD